MNSRFKQTALMSCDSYKLGHADQYPEGTTKVYSNFTPRSNLHLNQPEGYKDNRIVFFGLQAFLLELKEVFDSTFFNCNKDEVVNEFVEFVAPFVGPKGFDKSRIEALWEVGYLPVEVKALPEGSKVPIGVPVLTITNTLPEFYWLPNFLETWISSELWKASTSATVSNIYKRIISNYSDITGGSSEFVMWQGHDFSVRGMSGIQDSAKSGAGHLLSFLGTDNLPAVKLIKDAYGCTFVGGSVPATEHSVMCAGGEEDELQTFKRLLKTYPSGVVSIVSDTWSYWDVITGLAVQLKEDILNRVPDSLGLAKTVFRADSGDPVKIIVGELFEDISEFVDGNCITSIGDVALEIIRDRTGEETEHGEHGESEPSGIFKCNDKYYLVKVQIEWNRYDKQYYYIDSVNLKSIEEVELTPAQKGSVECLWEIFGGTTNEKGYRTLNQRVGLIYGDSITPDRCIAILEGLKQKGFASDNIVFGIGSYTFQYCTRDTLGFAMKATYVEIEGQPFAIFKNPKTDSGTKKSAKGLLKVTLEEGNYKLQDQVTQEEEQQGEFRTVFKDGEFKVLESFDTLRERLVGFN